MLSEHINQTQKKYEYDTHRVCSPKETLKRLFEIRKKAGIPEFSELKVKRIDNYDILGVPVFAVFPKYNKNIFGKSVHWGKGVTEEQSMTSGLMEFIERLSSFKRPADKTVRSDYNSLKNSISLWDFVPENRIRVKFTKEKADSTSIEWVEAYSLTKEKKVFVPVNRSYFYHNNELLTESSDTNGLASGNTKEESIIHGISEVVERHLFDVIFWNRIDVPKIDLNTINDPVINQLIDIFHKKGFEVYLSDYTYNLDIPTINAFAYNPQKLKARTLCATGTHPDKRIAVIRALTEIIQYRASSLYQKRNDSPQKTPSDLPSVWKENLFQRRNAPTIPFDAIKSISKKHISSEIENIKELLAKKGHEIIICDLTREELKIPTYRIIVKGLQPALHEAGATTLMENHARVSPYLNIYENHIKKFKL